jgi:hypothetical protein
VIQTAILLAIRELHSLDSSATPREIPGFEAYWIGCSGIDLKMRPDGAGEFVDILMEFFKLDRTADLGSRLRVTSDVELLASIIPGSSAIVVGRDEVR